MHIQRTNIGIKINTLTTALAPVDCAVGRLAMFTNIHNNNRKQHNQHIAAGWENSDRVTRTQSHRNCQYWAAANCIWSLCGIPTMFCGFNCHYYCREFGKYRAQHTWQNVTSSYLCGITSKNIERHTLLSLAFHNLIRYAHVMRTMANVSENTQNIANEHQNSLNTSYEYQNPFSRMCSCIHKLCNTNGSTRKNAAALCDNKLRRWEVLLCYNMYTFSHTHFTSIFVRRQQ